LTLYHFAASHHWRDRHSGERLAAGRSSRRMCGRGRVNALIPGACAIDTHREIGVSDTIFVDTCVVVGRDVPVAAHEVVDVVAQACRTGANARAEAELGIRDEAGPVVILKSRSERVSVDKATNWVAVTVSASVV